MSARIIEVHGINEHGIEPHCKIKLSKAESIGKGQGGEIFAVSCDALPPGEWVLKELIETSSAERECCGLKILQRPYVRVKFKYKKKAGKKKAGIIMQRFMQKRYTQDTKDLQTAVLELERVWKQLELLHKNEKVHSDIHRENIIQGPSGEFHVIDFGLLIAAGSFVQFPQTPVGFGPVVGCGLKPVTPDVDARQLLVNLLEDIVGRECSTEVTTDPEGPTLEILDDFCVKKLNELLGRDALSCAVKNVFELMVATDKLAVHHIGNTRRFPDLDHGDIDELCQPWDQHLQRLFKLAKPSVMQTVFKTLRNALFPGRV